MRGFGYGYVVTDMSEKFEKISSKVMVDFCHLVPAVKSI